MKIILLTIAPLIWGAGFAATRFTFEAYSALWSHGVRYLLAGIIVLPVFVYKFKEIKHKDAFIASIFLSLGLIVQTIGVKYTTLAKSGFFTTFYVIITPLLMMGIYKKRFPLSFWIYTFIALFGVLLMCDMKLESFNYGDFMIILSAVFFSFHIIFIDHITHRNSAILLNFAQCLYGGIIAVAIALLTEGLPSFETINPTSPLFSPNIFISFIVLSIFSSLIAFSIQIYAQEDIPPNIVSMIFLLESIFAAIFGYFYFDERLNWMNIIGIILILISVALLSMTKEPRH